MNSTKVVRIPQIIYNYRKRSSSVMLSSESQKKIIMDTLEYLNKRRKNVVKRFPQLKNDFDEHYLNMLVILSKNQNNNEQSLFEIKKLLKEYSLEKNKIHISFDLKMNILNLKYRTVKKLLYKKDLRNKKKEKDIYFR